MNDYTPDNICRCGFNGEGEHRCHRCHKQEGTPKFVANPNASLAGMQMKMSGYFTNACENCWKAFLAENKK